MGPAPAPNLFTSGRGMKTRDNGRWHLGGPWTSGAQWVPTSAVVIMEHGPSGQGPVAKARAWCRPWHPRRPDSVHTAWYSPHSGGPASVPRSGARCSRMHAIASCPSSSSTQVTKNRNTCHPNATFTTLRRSGHSAHVESSTSNTQPASSS